MRFLLLAAVLMFAVSACGKKAPLRAPDEPRERSLIG